MLFWTVSYLQYRFPLIVLGRALSIVADDSARDDDCDSEMTTAATMMMAIEVSVLEADTALSWEIAVRRETFQLSDRIRHRRNQVREIDWGTDISWKGLIESIPFLSYHYPVIAS